MFAASEHGSLLAGFHASHSVAPGTEQARKMTATSGLKCSALWMKPGLLGCWLKMCLTSTAWHSMKCYLTWNPSATKQRRRLKFRLLLSGRATRGEGYGLLPTPRASKASSSEKVEKWQARRDKGQRPGRDLGMVLGGTPHPEYLEVMMGYPVGWTETKPSEMPSSRNSPPNSSE